MEELADVIQSGKDSKDDGRWDPHAPGPEQYVALRLRADEVTTWCLNTVREIDSILVDAAHQLERYQRSADGAVRIKYRDRDGVLVPRLVMLKFGKSGVLIRELGRDQALLWSVQKDWGYMQKNPGMPMKRLLKALVEVIDFRREVMRRFGPASFKGTQPLSRTWPALRQETFEALDNVGRSMKVDWLAAGRPMQSRFRA
jgi:hypothetical protein